MLKKFLSATLIACCAIAVTGLSNGPPQKSHHLTDQLGNAVVTQAVAQSATQAAAEISKTEPGHQKYALPANINGANVGTNEEKNAGGGHEGQTIAGYAINGNTEAVNAVNGAALEFGNPKLRA